MPEPLDKALYARVKAEADKKFLAPTSVYKSSWVVAEYKRRGGIYTEKKQKNQGLLRWYREKWIDLARPIKDNSGKIVDYEDCGREKATTRGVYPLCRPMRRITQHTPTTVTELTPAAIRKAEKEKQELKQKGHITFDKKQKNKK
ncbi:hypothetical protein [Dishui Lake large algae virus 1]|nr:hypothetical protein [Dishui Lake large algae virus 1]